MVCHSLRKKTGSQEPSFAPRGTSASRSAKEGTLVVSNHLTAVAGAHCSPAREVDGVGDIANGAVEQKDVDRPGVSAVGRGGDPLGREHARSVARGEGMVVAGRGVPVAHPDAAGG